MNLREVSQKIKNGSREYITVFILKFKTKE